MCVSEAFCPNIQPRAHARLTGLTTDPSTDRLLACRLLSLHKPVARAARARAGRYTCASKRGARRAIQILV